MSDYYMLYAHILNPNSRYNIIASLLVHIRRNTWNCSQIFNFQEDYIKEMSIGLKEVEHESESEPEVNEEDVCKSGVYIRKTRSQRNKEKAEKLKVSTQ